MINKLLLSLYDYYRKKNDPISAIFHSKVLLGVFLIMVIFIIFGSFLVLGRKIEGQIDSNSSKLVLVGILIVFVSFLWFFTDSSKKLESKRVNSEIQYRKYFFISFYLAIPILLYLIVSIRT